MAEFLTTNGVSYQIEQIITGAKAQLVLLSPYLRLSQNSFERLKDADRKGVRIIIVYGKEELKSEQKDLLSKLNNLDLRFCQNLHAKCYFNDNVMVITSMNFYDFSEKTNREMGVLILREQDNELFNKAFEEVKSILRNSEKANLSQSFIRESVNNQRYTVFGTNGFCIRCGVRIAYDPEKPYCGSCYHKWAAFGNPFYIESFCHRCGKPEVTAMDKPLCYSCFQVYKAGA